MTPLIARLANGTTWAILPTDDWVQLSAEVTQARIATMQRELERVVGESDALGLPSGARASWRRGTWA